MVSPHRKIPVEALEKPWSGQPPPRLSRITVGDARVVREVSIFESRLAKVSALVRGPDNLSSYEEPALVERLSSRSELQPPEAAILEQLGAWLSGTRMLDLGVGGGRTTLHFAPVVASYVGVDYAQPMVDSCVVRLASRFPDALFALGDGRDLSSFGPEEFDFVLFSYNGLDSLDHDDRLRALRELHRVLSQKGVLCFSSHNTYALPELYAGERRRRVKSTAFWMLNGSRHRLVAEPHVMVRDGTGHYRMIQYYVRPSESLDQLDSAGFTVTDVFGLDGRRIEVAGIDRARDAWLYYVASPKQ
jgi:ubiquinone/menaquinone biosynthesis C-methylase UbiE